MLKKSLRTLILSLFFILNSNFIAKLTAHPHIFIENRMELVFDEKGFSGIKMEWTFDEMTSSGFIIDYDVDGNGLFSNSEKQVLKKEVFDYLKNFEYMTHIDIDGKVFKVKYIKNFVPKINDGLLIYHFFIPCHVSASHRFKRIAFSVYDKELFVGFSSKENAVTMKKQSQFETQTMFRENPNKTYYYGQLHPEETILMFKQK
jgi:ABC-type uncharacterized transport system substrate-binding protein